MAMSSYLAIWVDERYWNKWWLSQSHSLREKRLYSKFFWSVISRIRTECKDIRSISPYSAQILENTDQKNSECLESNIVMEDYHWIYLNFIDQFQVRTWQNWCFAKINMQIQTTAL